MKVCIAVKSRFHAFYLASQLARHGHLKKLITTYPQFEAIKYDVPKFRISSMWWFEVLDRAVRKLKGNSPQALLDVFDHLAARCIPRDSDIFVGWSGCSEHSIKKAQRLGALAIVERGSTHIEVQDETIAEEFDRLGLPRPPRVDRATCEKEKREYQQADYISIPSTHVEQSFIRKGIPASKLLRVPYGVDLTHFAPGKKKDSVFRIIHCGALSVRKGVHYLLQAFSELRLPDAELWFVGPVLDEIKPFLQRYASSSVKVWGAFPEFTLHQYYAQSSVYCLCSLEEGMAMTLLQAMACSLPVICTSQTGGQDIVRDGVDGFIVQPRDMIALKEKIVYAYEHQQALAGMGAAARQNILDHFTWTHYGERMIGQYEAALARRTPPLAS